MLTAVFTSIRRSALTVVSTLFALAPTSTLFAQAVPSPDAAVAAPRPVATPTPTQTPGPTLVQLEVRIANVPSDEGMVRCLLFNRADGFPTRPERAIQMVRVAPRNRGAVCTFTGIPLGTYAVAIHHDRDGNGRVNIGFFGPTEALAASRNARGFLGPPSFDAARFSISNNWRIDVRM